MNDRFEVPLESAMISLSLEPELRKWCLERAFETRSLSGVNHMEVTNVANDYYRWIMNGECQGNLVTNETVKGFGDA